MAKSNVIGATSSDAFAGALVVSISVSMVLASIYLSPTLGLPHFAIELLISGMPAIGAILSHRKLAGRKSSPVPFAIAVAYGIAVILSIFTSPAFDSSAAVLLAPAVPAIVMTFVGGLLTRREMLALLRVVCGIAVVQALLAIAEVQGHEPWAVSLAATQDVGYLIRPNLVLLGLLRASGTMGHPILLGVICSVAWIFVFARTVRRMPLKIALLALLSWGVLLSGSRSSLVALGVAVIIYFAHKHSSMSRKIRTLILIAVIPLMWFYVNAAVQDARVLSPFSLSNRVGAWARFVGALSRPGIEPLFGENSSFSLETVADNQFLTTLGRYGVVGILILIAALVYAITSRSPVFSAVTASIGFMFLSFDVLSFSFPTLLFWLFVGASRSAAAFPEASVRPRLTSQLLRGVRSSSSDEQPATGRIIVGDA